MAQNVTGQSDCFLESYNQTSLEWPDLLNLFLYDSLALYVEPT